MHFNYILGFATLGLFALPATAAINPDRFALDLQGIANIAKETADTARSLNLILSTAATRQASSPEPRILDNLNRIVDGFNGQVFELIQKDPLPTATATQQATLCRTFNNLSTAQVDLLQALTFRSIFFSTAAVANGIYGAIEKLFGMVGSVADGVTKIAPSCADQVRGSSATLQNAIQNGLYQFNVVD